MLLHTSSLGDEDPQCLSNKELLKRSLRKMKCNTVGSYGIDVIKMSTNNSSSKRKSSSIVMGNNSSFPVQKRNKNVCIRPLRKIETTLF